MAPDTVDVPADHVTMWTAKDIWLGATFGLVALALILHSVFPRYEWRPVGESGSAIVVFDRWSGRFQRAVYDENGKLKVTDVWTPF